MTKKQLSKYVQWHYDAGHAWLRIPHCLLTLPVARTISHYSYLDAKYFYLEEDSDAYKYLQSIHEDTELPTVGIPSVDHGSRSPIRRLARFDAKVFTDQTTTTTKELT